MNEVRGVRRGLPPAVTSGLVALVAVAVLVAVLALALAARRGDDGTAPSGSTSSPSDETVDTVTTVADVAGGPLDEQRRRSTEEQIGQVVDRFLDGAYLGDFPRRDYSPAFADFTPRAAELASRQVDVLTNAGISDEITSATATNRRLRLSVLAPDGRARGITARFVLDFTTTGTLEQSQRVLGQLYLTKPLGQAWQVFGFRVDQPVTR